LWSLMSTRRIKRFRRVELIVKFKVVGV
jgi:hypothetical protein